MKYLYNLSLLVIGIVCMLPASASAQFVEQSPHLMSNTGSIYRTEIKAQDTQPVSKGPSLFSFFHMKMLNSYEATFGSFGGHYYNQNMYTNTMLFSFSPKFTGRLDLSIAHSPFGNSLMSNSNKPQFFVRNAELNYHFNDHAMISVQFRQVPSSLYGMGYYGSPLHNDFMNPFNR